MPSEQPFLGQRLVESLCGIEHHLHDAVHEAIGRLQAADVHAQAASHGRADLIGIEPLALNLAGLQDVIRQGAENRFPDSAKTERLHFAGQAPLKVPGRRQGHCKAIEIPPELRPVRKLMDVQGHTSQLSRLIIAAVSRFGESLTASRAANRPVIHRRGVALELVEPHPTNQLSQPRDKGRDRAGSGCDPFSVAARRTYSTCLIFTSTSGKRLPRSAEEAKSK